MIARVDTALGRVIDRRPLQLLRLFAGPIVVVHLWPFLQDAAGGRIYRDTFYEPYAAWYPELPRSVYVAMLCAGVVFAIAMAVGLWVRVTGTATFAIVAYNLFLSTTHFHNNRAYLFVVLGGLALAPSPVGPAWPLWLLRIEAASVYGGSGLSKLLDRDWFDGTVTWGRVANVQDRIPDWAVGALTDRALHTGYAKVIIATELFIALGLWWRRTRWPALAVAVCFHIAIALTADVQVFSMLGLAALVIWLPAGPAATSRR